MQALFPGEYRMDGRRKLVTIVFARNAEVMALVEGLLLWIGAATAVIGALTAWAQRHLKRLLAFSTIAHLGIVLTSLAAGEGAGHAGLLLYIVGHGLVKGSLFMAAGILLALRASVDEIDLYGRARQLWPVALVMGGAGLLLGGFPFGLLHGGLRLIEAATDHRPAIRFAQLLATAVTGAAMPRATLRIFAGRAARQGRNVRGDRAGAREG